MQLWTKEHFWQLIPTVIVMVIIALVLNHFIGKKSLKVRMIPFNILTVLLLISEVGKQYFSLTQEGGYDLYHIPLHVCSLFISLLPAMSFYNGKHKKEIRALTCSVVTALMIFMTVYPNLIYGPWNITGFFKNYFDFHTVFFHNVVIFEFILIIVLRLHHIEHSKKNIKTIALFGAGFSAAAGIMSQLLQTNYAKFLNCNDIPPLADLVNAIKSVVGEGVGQFIYVVILGILHILFFLGSYYLYRAIDKLNVKLRGKAQ